MNSKYLLGTAASLSITTAVAMYAQQGAPSVTSGSASLRNERGSTLFQQTVENGTCEEAPDCGVTFRTVAAHTRLVVTHFNASTYSVPIAGTNLVFSTLRGAADGVVNTFQHTGPVSGSSFANAGTEMYFEAGESPLVVVYNSSGLIDVRVTLSGYVIHLR